MTKRPVEFDGFYPPAAEPAPMLALACIGFMAFFAGVGAVVSAFWIVGLISGLAR